MWAAGILLLAGVGLFLYLHLLRPPTEEELVREALESLLRAVAEDDHEKIWDLAGERVKQQVRRDYGRIRSPDYESWRWGVFWRHTGLTLSRVGKMSPEQFFVEARRGLRERDLYGWYAEEKTAVRRVEVTEVSIRGRSAVVDVRFGRENWGSLHFESEGGAWHLTDPEGFVWYVPGPWFRKVAAFLPRDPVSPDDIDLVLEIGPGEYERDQIEGLALMLNALLEKEPEDARVLLEVSPELPWKLVVHAHSAFLLAGVRECYFAAAAKGPMRPGIRLNGVPAEDLAEGTRFQDPSQRPAVSRIIGLSQR